MEIFNELLFHWNTTAETYKEKKHEKFPNRNNFVSVIEVMRLGETSA